MNKSNIFRYLKVISTLLPVVILSGCGGEFTYKRGAGVGELRQQESICKDQGMTDKAVDECLKENGWIVVDLESDEPLLGTTLKPKKTLDPVTVEYQKATNNPLSPKEPAADASPTPDPVYDAEKNPYQLIQVNSWWKSGAGPEQLMDDGNNCLTHLPEGHSANGNFSKVTLGLAYCMQEKGWKVLLRN